MDMEDVYRWFANHWTPAPTQDSLETVVWTSMRRAEPPFPDSVIAECAPTFARLVAPCFGATAEDDFDPAAIVSSLSDAALQALAEYAEVTPDAYPWTLIAFEYNKRKGEIVNWGCEWLQVDGRFVARTWHVLSGGL